jgi:hypothetical protein
MKLFMFERWGGLRPAWKIDPQGRKWIPLILGIWIMGDKMNIKLTKKWLQNFVYGADEEINRGVFVNEVTSHTEEEDEHYDCPIHGRQEGKDCPRC